MHQSHFAKRHSIEPLEARIAPASAVASADWVTATFGGPIVLQAGQGLSTAGANAGTYLLYVEKGEAMVFLTDLNKNGDVEFNEITGIAAGDGLRLISFVDIHGDIATNLVKTQAVLSGVVTTKISLSDSDNNRKNDFLELGDGRVLQNSTIEKIELRSLTIDDIAVDQDGNGALTENDVLLRKAYSSYSIFGNIYAGRGFGVEGGGLIIDSRGATEDSLPGNFGFEVRPSVGSIKTGTRVSGERFSYGASNEDDAGGRFVTFTPLRGQTGGDIIGVRAVDAEMTFTIDGLYAGNGGTSARGGNIVNVRLNGDDVGGYRIIAGNGGNGLAGGAGGSIINFADLGSLTGQVIVQSGTGGAGATGAGGVAGGLSFETFNVYGNVNVSLGSGGDGFTLGGNGAALSNGVFSQPLPGEISAGNGYGTTHQSIVDGDLVTPGFQAVYSPQIGTHTAVDIDSDGFGDFVYTSKVNSQLVVMFGNGAGGFRTVPDPDGGTTRDRIYLPGVRNPEALVVADLNGDGNPDIAVGSRDPGSHAGVAVYLARYEDSNADGLTVEEDADADGIDDFLGFEDVKFSALPQLDAGAPSFGSFPYWQGPAQVSNLTAGDYNGDGVVELAVIATYYGSKLFDTGTGITTSLAGENQVLLLLTADQELNNVTGNIELTGQFYADFGTKQKIVNNVVVPAVNLTPFAEANELLGVGGSFADGSVVFESTALSTGATQDVVMLAIRDFDSPSLRRVGAIDLSNPLAGPTRIGAFGLGQVDTNRNLGANAVSSQPVVPHDFTVVDLDSDGNADVAAISFAPQGYLVGVLGDGTGNGTFDSGFGDNAGNFFGTLGYETGINLMAIKSADIDADGDIDDLAIFEGTGGVNRMIYASGGDEAPTRLADGDIGGGTIPNESITEIFLPVAGDTTQIRYAVSTTTEVVGAGALNFRFNDPFVNSALVSASQPLLETGLKLVAGDGGDALVGRGGSGGVIGAGARFTTTTDSITGFQVTDLVGTVQIEVSGSIRMLAGDGGNGFSSGGRGGSINGVVLRPLVDENNVFLGVTASLTGGDGGRGVSGAGGAGGDLLNNSIYSGGRFAAGAGGAGRVGGDGGDVIGNGTTAYDTSAINIVVLGGAAGGGVIRGGVGGDIRNFSPVAGDPGVESGRLRYTAGDGGSAVAGPGGRGGSVLNSSPKPGDGIQLEILVEGGDGGDGRAGGAGGDINGFVSTPATNSKKVEVIGFIGGNGGDATAGVGGKGGDVIGVSIPTRGESLAPGTFTNFSFNRVMGGDGGDSASGRGGNGGNVSGLDSGASEGSFAIVSGTGGDGLTAGGNGGNVLNTKLSMPTSTAYKALVVAGAGGNASSFVVNPNDPGSPNQAQNAFGGRIGVGGNGGNIIGFTQTGQIGASFDFVSGNGGDTINYGSILDKKGFGGKGGNIERIKVIGDIGNALDPDVPINGYNNLLGGETMQEWINANIRTSAAIKATLDNTSGNVGIVVGTAGRSKAVVMDPVGAPTVYETLPSRDVANGSLVDVEARNIMSAVAGSVDRIASIQVVRNLRVLGGIIGADKEGFPGDTTGAKNYRDENGVLISKPVRDGRLVDGAVIAKVIFDSRGKLGTLPSDRVFIL